MEIVKLTHRSARLLVVCVLTLVAAVLTIGVGADISDDNRRSSATATLLTIADAIGPAQVDYVE